MSDVEREMKKTLKLMKRFMEKLHKEDLLDREAIVLEKENEEINSIKHISDETKEAVKQITKAQKLHIEAIKKLQRVKVGVLQRDIIKQGYTVEDIIRM